jgi:hypothetical protein
MEYLSCPDCRIGNLTSGWEALLRGRMKRAFVLAVVFLCIPLLSCSKKSPSSKTKFQQARGLVIEQYSAKSYDAMVTELEKSLGQPAKKDSTGMLFWFDKDEKGICVSVAVGKNAEGKTAFYDTLGAEPGDCK